MTTVLAIETMLELGCSIHETKLKSGATRELVEAVFMALIGQGDIPQICPHCYGHGAHGSVPCKHCQGHPGSWRAPP